MSETRLVAAFNPVAPVCNGRTEAGPRANAFACRDHTDREKYFIFYGITISTVILPSFVWHWAAIRPPALCVTLSLDFSAEQLCPVIPGAPPAMSL
jgi:hypothetical protein